MGATERIKIYLDNKGVSKYAFYKKTGFSNKFLDNSSNMGTDRAEIILRHYSDINLEWLITGQGEMLKTEAAPIPATPPPGLVVFPAETETNNMLLGMLREKDAVIGDLQKKIGGLEKEVELLNEQIKKRGTYNDITISTIAAEPQVEYKKEPK